MKLRIFKKLFFTTSAVLIITLTLVFVIMSVAVSNLTSKNKYEILDRTCNVATDIISEDSEDFDETAVTVIVSLAEANDIDLFIVNHHGRVILCGCNDFTQKGNCNHTNTLLHPEFLGEVTDEGLYILSSVDGMYDNINYTAAKKIDADTDYYVFAVSSVMSSTEFIKVLLGMYAISAIFPLLFMFIAEYSLVYRFMKPLKYMSIAAKSIARGDFTKRVPVMSNDEIGELSVLFNRMTDSLARTEYTGKSFVANISHELKTPMTTISGFIDGIIDGTIDKDHQDYYLKIVSDEVKRMARLVQSMLSLTRLESDENPVKETDIKLAETIISVVVSMEQKITSRNINIVGLEELSETIISADADLLHQVVYNLTDNAVKFTRDGGTIEYTLHRISDRLEFKIKNTGDGIPKKDLPHVFERFYKIDQSRSKHKDSLGLGLYICKTIIDLHKGSIVVESDGETYTEFTVWLPINKE